MMESSYAKLLASLAEARIDFVTVGGLACAMNGHVRMTEDVDILVRREDRNLNLLLATLTGFGEGYARELSLEDFPDEEGAVRVIEEFPIDIFVRMNGHTYESLQSNIEQLPLNDLSLPYLDIAGLLLLKKDSLREKDQIDVLALNRLLENE
jgi:hypothetical protein